VIKEGEAGNRFYLIMEGKAKAVKKENDQEIQVFDYRENEYFGELALLGDTNRQASIVVTSDMLVVASLDFNSFKRLLGPIEPILMRQKDKYNKYKQKIVNK
jgi:cAMP-dependent protein kinase regulator